MIFKTTSKKILGVLLCLLFLIIPQLNIDGYVNSTITSKFIYFSYACLFIALAHCIRLVLKKQVSFSLTKQDLLLLVLLIYISINRYFIQEFYGFSIRYMELVGLSVLYVVLRDFEIKNFIWLFIAIIISGIIQAIYGNLQLLGFYDSNHSGFKMTGSFFNPGPYAGFLASVWPLALGSYLFREQLYNKIILKQKTTTKKIQLLIKYSFEYIPLLGVISIALVLPASQSRAAWLAVLFSSLFLLELRYQILRKLFNTLNGTKKIMLKLLALIITTISFFGVYHFKKSSSDGRLFIWKVSSNIIKDYPVFGVGFDRFKAHYMNYQGAYFKEYGDKIPEVFVADNTSFAFNEFIALFTENGIIGVFLIVTCFYLVGNTRTKKENHHLIILLKTVILTIGVFAFFSYPMIILPIKLIIILTLAVLATINVNTINLTGILKIKKINFIFKTSLVILIILISILSFGHIYELDQNYKIWNTALTNYKYGDYESSIEEYEDAYPAFKNNGEFLLNYGKTLLLYKQNKKAVLILELSKNYLNNSVIKIILGDAYKNLQQFDNAERSYIAGAHMVPVKFYPLYLLAKLYEENHKTEKATNMANIILNKNIKIESGTITEIKTEMKNLITNNPK